ncbi:MAG: hypothetical protein JSS14_14325 [Proteobacteria bacterium]|nr:hypothetical protein [Pseudomonadota bacterium]
MAQSTVMLSILPPDFRLWLKESDGRATIDGNSFTNAEFAALISQMRKSCMSRGAFDYTNLTQKANLTLDVIDFLDTNVAQ